MGVSNLYRKCNLKSERHGRLERLERLWRHFKALVTLKTKQEVNKRYV